MSFLRRTAASLAAFVAASVTIAAGPSALAQGPVQLDLFRPAPIDGDGFAVSNAGGQGHLRGGAQLVFDYGHDPLVWETRSGSRSSESRHVVEHQLVATVLGSIGLFDRLVLFAGLPVNLVQRGERTQDLGIPAADGTGLGNPLLGARVLLLPERSEGLGLALQAEVTFPLASAANASQSYTGESRVTFHPQAIAHYQAGPFRIAMNLGFRIRKDATFAALDVGDELTFGLGARMRVAPRSSILAEVHGTSTITNFFGREETPIEAIGGYEFRHESGIALMAGAGAGTRGFGAPDARGVLSFRYTSPARARADETDEEPIEEPEDEAVVAEEPVADDAATTAVAAEDEGAADEGDLSDEPSAFGATARTAGDETDESDADGDGIPDGDDDCPELAGVAQFNGCPHAPLYVIEERIYFEYDSSRLERVSFEVLDGIAELLLVHPEVRTVRVEGHADTRGTHEYNVELSRRRATTVTRYLVRRGVPASRIDIRGFGHGQPAHAAATEEDEHARNRRVEFRIVGVE